MNLVYHRWLEIVMTSQSPRAQAEKHVAYAQQAGSRSGSQNEKIGPGDLCILDRCECGQGRKVGERMGECASVLGWARF